MNVYQLMEDAEGFELSGGKLKEPMRFNDMEEGRQSAIHLVGFLSQYTGAELRIYSAAGKGLTETRAFPQKSHPAASELGNI